MALRSTIAGTGLGTPSITFTNHDFEKIIDTSDEWIRTRTGIRERKFIDRENGEFLETLCIRAGKEALERANTKPEDIEFVIVATTSPDTFLPNTSSRVVSSLGLVNAAGVDQNSACAGFIYAMHTADSFIRAGTYRNVLVFGADAMSAVINMTDRATSVLFGDGCGACVVKAVDADVAKDSIILGSKLYTDFDKNEALAVLGGGSRIPFWSDEYKSVDNPEASPAFLRMNGQEVFKGATRGMVRAAKEVLESCQVTTDQIKWFVPHQANLRIIEMVGKMLNFPMERVYVNVDRWGNTSAATVAICLAEMQRDGLIQKGDLVLMDVFGGGFSYGAMLVRW